MKHFNNNYYCCLQCKQRLIKICRLPQQTSIFEFDVFRKGPRKANSALKILKQKAKNEEISSFFHKNPMPFTTPDKILPDNSRNVVRGYFRNRNIVIAKSLRQLRVHCPHYTPEVKEAVELDRRTAPLTSQKRSALPVSDGLLAGLPAQANSGRSWSLFFFRFGSGIWIAEWPRVITVAQYFVIVIILARCGPFQPFGWAKVFRYGNTRPEAQDK